MRNEHAPRAVALRRLLDGRGLPPTVVCWSLLVLCVLVTGAGLISPEFQRQTSGVAPRVHAWQPLTAAFQHGWPGFPPLLHLVLDGILLLLCGRPCERLLGSPRFLALSLAALLANALAQLQLGGVNGSSLFIWSWGPPLWIALAQARSRDPGAAGESAFAQLRGLQLLMYGLVTLVMGGLPYAAGFRGNPLAALAMGNSFHLIATGVGLLLALAWRGAIERRLGWLTEIRPARHPDDSP